MLSKVGYVVIVLVLVSGSVASSCFSTVILTLMFSDFMLKILLLMSYSGSGSLAASAFVVYSCMLSVLTSSYVIWFFLLILCCMNICSSRDAFVFSSALTCCGSSFFIEPWMLLAKKFSCGLRLPSNKLSFCFGLC